MSGGHPFYVQAYRTLLNEILALTPMEKIKNLLTEEHYNQLILDNERKLESLRLSFYKFLV